MWMGDYLKAYNDFVKQRLYLLLGSNQLLRRKTPILGKHWCFFSQDAVGNIMLPEDNPKEGGSWSSLRTGSEACNKEKSRLRSSYPRMVRER
ncbi:hypothetical protein TNIN_185371 [Trichonephila inaurata madagascariensis]|uniref:Uncharacterized protein n=1 Tax=Trichonephila inaurata madagascariensis TaxID=2747483 RepID=A0A8X7CL97_9ARAC|nr:hypothetical protein TNIN_185371 [Trichonephila inaurata madagascariensis]